MVKTFLLRDGNDCPVCEDSPASEVTLMQKGSGSRRFVLLIGDFVQAPKRPSLLGRRVHQEFEASVCETYLGNMSFARENPELGDYVRQAEDFLYRQIKTESGDIKNGVNPAKTDVIVISLGLGTVVGAQLLLGQGLNEVASVLVSPTLCFPAGVRRYIRKLVAHSEWSSDLGTSGQVVLADYAHKKKKEAGMRGATLGNSKTLPMRNPGSAPNGHSHSPAFIHFPQVVSKDILSLQRRLKNDFRSPDSSPMLVIHNPDNPFVPFPNVKKAVKKRQRDGHAITLTKSPFATNSSLSSANECSVVDTILQWIGDNIWGNDGLSRT